MRSWLLDGVRQGQPLGALLGYRFERRLHDDNLDVEIARFRRIAPLVGRQAAATDLPVESIAANNVVDGLRLVASGGRSIATVGEQRELRRRR